MSLTRGQSSVVRALTAPALLIARLTSGRRPVEDRDECLRVGGDGDPLTATRAALRGGGASAWMRHGGG